LQQQQNFNNTEIAITASITSNTTAKTYTSFQPPGGITVTGPLSSAARASPLKKMIKNTL